MIGENEGAFPLIAFYDNSLVPEEIHTTEGYSHKDIHGISSQMKIVDALTASVAEASSIYMPRSMLQQLKGYPLEILD